MKNIEIEIKKMGINGEGIGYYNKKVVFVEGALVGEFVLLKDIVKKNNYYIANVDKIIKKSNNRIIPKCKIYDNCNICSLMCLDYNEQLKVKEDYLKESIYKYAKKNVSVNKVIRNDDYYHYRNSIKLPLFNMNNSLKIGIYKRDSNHFILLNDCIVQDERINKTVNIILNVLNKFRYRAYDKKTKMGIRYLLLRVFDDEIMLTFVVGKNTKLIDEVLDNLMKIKDMKSINVTTNTKNSNELIVEPVDNIRGKKTININFNKLKYKISCESFFQLNTKQAIKLYDVVKSYLGFDNKLVLDLYCGIGSISCYINENASNIIGIDITKSAIRDAKENAKLNKIDNIKFVCGDVDDKIKTHAKDKNIDAIIVDPPRLGLSEYTMQSIIKSKTNKLIYVSCNPSSLAKDLSVLLEYYNIKDITLVDMFSHTMHVECVVLMSRVNK